METAKQVAEVTLPAVPIGVSGAIIFGYPLQDWIVVGTATLLVGNLIWMGLRFKDRFFNDGK